MEFTLGITPLHGKMTETAKAIICHLCEKRPWEGKTEQFKYKLPPEFYAEREEISCLIDICYNYSCKIGMFEHCIGSASPISSLGRKNAEVYLNLNPETCEAVFTPNLPDTLDMFGAWDDIVSREPMEDEEDET